MDEPWKHVKWNKQIQKNIYDSIYIIYLESANSETENRLEGSGEGIIVIALMNTEFLFGVMK